MFTFSILAIGAIFFGYITNELFVGGGTEVFLDSTFTHPNHFRLFDSSLSKFTILKLLVSLPLVFVISLLPLKRILKDNKFKNINNYTTTNISVNLQPIKVLPLYWSTRVLSHFDIYNHWIMHNSLNNSISLYRYFDKGLLQYFGPFGIFRL